MLENADQEKVGFEGYKTQSISMYHSLWSEPKVHRWEAQEEGLRF